MSLPVSLLFTVADREGALEEVLTIFKRLAVSLTRIESRPSKSSRWMYDIVVDFNPPKTGDEQRLRDLEAALATAVSHYQFIEPSSTNGGNCVGNVLIA